MLHRLWTLPLERPARGLCFAREAGRLAAWDAHWLFWTNRAGERQAQARFGSPPVAGAVSEDGSAFAAGCEDGHVSWLAPDLRPRWEKVLPAAVTALALDSLGMFLAVSDARGKLHLYDEAGQAVREWPCPRPPKFLAFDPTSGRLVAAADFGWLAAFDAEKADPVWRDSPVVNVGGMALTAGGGRVVLACFSDGLRVYQDGKPHKPEFAVPPCRLSALNHDGTRVVTAGLDGQLAGFAGKSEPVFTHKPSAPPAALALDAFGDTLYIAAADRLKAIDLREGWQWAPSI